MEQEEWRFALRRRAFCLYGLLICAMLLSACAAPDKAGNSMVDRAASLMQEAEAQRKKGNPEGAIVLIHEAAKASPASVAPWLANAHIQFDAANYVSAAQAADEALRREAGNQDARHLLMLSGLRIAADAAKSSRANGPMVTAARLEAESLAGNLRALAMQKKEGEQTAPQEKPAADASARPRAAANPRPQLGNVPAVGGKDPFRSLR